MGLGGGDKRNYEAPEELLKFNKVARENKRFQNELKRKNKVKTKSDRLDPCAERFYFKPKINSAFGWID